jgi:hypothetical protein
MLSEACGFGFLSFEPLAQIKRNFQLHTTNEEYRTPNNEHRQPQLTLCTENVQ